MTFADLTLNTKAHTVYRAKREVHLTPKEFMLLEYLLRNKGAVLLRSMILEHVWNMDTDPFSNTIESHVLSLRRKLDGNGKRLILSRAWVIRSVNTLPLPEFLVVVHFDSADHLA